MTGLNLSVGFIVGMVQHGMSAADAAATYTILAVGDGLVSQIPALLVSTAAAVIVTRASLGSELAPALVGQLGQRKSALTTTAWALAGVGLMPGMPVIPFFALAFVLYLAGRTASTDSAQAARAAEGKQAEQRADRPSASGSRSSCPSSSSSSRSVTTWSRWSTKRKAASSSSASSAIRRNLATELGILVPAVHIRDNLRLRPGAYRLLLSGNEIGRGELRVHRVLAMDPAGNAPPINGEEVREPAFGLPARWINPSERDLAESFGYTVVDPATVAATHFTEMLRSVAPDVLGRTEAQELVDSSPARAQPGRRTDSEPAAAGRGDQGAQAALARVGVDSRLTFGVRSAVRSRARDEGHGPVGRAGARAFEPPSVESLHQRRWQDLCTRPRPTCRRSVPPSVPRCLAVTKTARLVGLCGARIRRCHDTAPAFVRGRCSSKCLRVLVPTCSRPFGPLLP